MCRKTPKRTYLLLVHKTQTGEELCKKNILFPNMEDDLQVKTLEIYRKSYLFLNVTCNENSYVFKYNFRRCKDVLYSSHPSLQERAVRVIKENRMNVRLLPDLLRRRFFWTAYVRDVTQFLYSSVVDEVH